MKEVGRYKDLEEQWILFSLENALSDGMDVSDVGIYERRFLNAVSEGHEWVKKLLADLYSNKAFGKYDLNTALFLLQEMKNKGELEEIEFLEKIADIYLTQEEDSKKAITYFEQAASLGCTNSIWQLAEIYSYGIGVEKNKEKAIFWYEEGERYGTDFSDELKELRKK